ncbi:MAG: V-type ATP synthase subunit I [Synergistaceae bacterium]|jgi:V/A-type H+-transporting ATPase subunit I|nr:V-type ATP synthase subunit I [Synergistaceae bacterium]
MAIEAMRKVRVAAHKSVADDVWNRIQSIGCCQVIQGGRERTEERDAASLKTRVRRIDDLLSEVRFVMRFLEPYASGKGGGLSNALGDLPAFSASELEAMASAEKFLDTATIVRALEKRASDVKSSLSRVTGLIASLAPLASLPYSLDFYNRGTESVQGNLFSVPAVSVDEFKSRVSSSLGKEAEIYVSPGGPKDTVRIVSAIYARSVAEKFSLAASGIQMSRIEVPPQLTGLPRGEISRLEKELSSLKAEEAAIASEIKNIAHDAWGLCELCSDKWGVERAKLEAILDGEHTEQIIIESFWIPAEKVADFKAAVSQWNQLTDIAVSEPEEGDEPPVLLKNKKLFAPVEPLISMFGLPGYRGLDPTSVVAPFFYIFFGICFGDAAYGAIVASALIFLMLRNRVAGTIRKFMLVLIISNICAVIFGALTFSWFGDSITSFSFLHFLIPLEKIKILDPMNDPMTMLFVSLAFGFVQIFIGLVIAMYDNLRKGDKFAAFADQGGWMIFLCSLVLMGLASAGAVPVPSGIFKTTAVIGALILVATQGREKENILGKLFSGVLSLYNVTGYLGDLLSYSRLLALGLSSAAVGTVINLLANLVSGVPYVGVLLGLLIFILGHSFGIAVNVLGAFVHSLRLQYVEFFGKFYSASGEEFAPLAVRTQYVRVSGE